METSNLLWYWAEFRPAVAFVERNAFLTWQIRSVWNAADSCWKAGCLQKPVAMDISRRTRERGVRWFWFGSGITGSVHLYFSLLSFSQRHIVWIAVGGRRIKHGVGTVMVVGARQPEQRGNDKECVYKSSGPSQQRGWCVRDEVDGRIFLG